ncbi:hypothetical protein SSS_00974 [Sarcoptes scabiei]|uniref:Uncharacterized protein n=1 Tax=Sarcoptes scabiei TaxID=52283 RepID=A0A834RFR2_SARSC|nr:hypothetical protein SSS_00974 [Sarcoptes scabiei]
MSKPEFSELSSKHAISSKEVRKHYRQRLKEELDRYDPYIKRFRKAQQITFAIESEDENDDSPTLAMVRDKMMAEAAKSFNVTLPIISDDQELLSELSDSESVILPNDMQETIDLTNGMDELVNEQDEQNTQRKNSNCNKIMFNESGIKHTNPRNDLENPDAEKGPEIFYDLVNGIDNLTPSDGDEIFYDTVDEISNFTSKNVNKVPSYAQDLFYPDFDRDPVLKDEKCDREILTTDDDRPPEFKIPIDKHGNIFLNMHNHFVYRDAYDDIKSYNQNFDRNASNFIIKPKLSMRQPTKIKDTPFNPESFNDVKITFDINKCNENKSREKNLPKTDQIDASITSDGIEIAVDDNECVEMNLRNRKKVASKTEPKNSRDYSKSKTSKKNIRYDEEEDEIDVNDLITNGYDKIEDFVSQKDSRKAQDSSLSEESEVNDSEIKKIFSIKKKTKRLAHFQNSSQGNGLLVVME